MFPQKLDKGELRPCRKQAARVDLMKFYCLSDLHNEFGEFTDFANPDDYDAVLLAGDIDRRNLKINLNRLLTLIKTYGRKRPRYSRHYRQAVAFQKKFDQYLKPVHRSVVESYLELPNSHFLKRAFLLSSRRYLPTGLIRTLSFMVFFNKKVFV